ncbi:MAG: two-component system LytT family response regulator [Litorivivens sp.]|jgi:two-component system LytT family response regulator
MDSKRIGSLIVDDDPFILELLQDKLALHFPEVEILATAENGSEGLEKIEAFQPELVFLDVEMTDMTGFEMLTRLRTINFQTIFITSYSHYAIMAIRFSALDYLLKPIDLAELKKAIARYKDIRSVQPHEQNLEMALQNVHTKDLPEHTLILKTQEGDLKLAVKDIIHIEGDRNYSLIYMRNNLKKLVTKTLVDLEELLDYKGFYRCHRSHILNADHITSYSNGIFAVLSNQKKIPISRRKKKPFSEWLEVYQAMK